MSHSVATMAYLSSNETRLIHYLGHPLLLWLMFSFVGYVFLQPVETPAVEGEQTSVGLPPEAGSSGRPLSGLLTPTTTIESLTKELEHSLDLASATSEAVVLHRVSQPH